MRALHVLLLSAIPWLGACSVAQESVSADLPPSPARSVQGPRDLDLPGSIVWLAAQATPELHGVDELHIGWAEQDPEHLQGELAPSAFPSRVAVELKAVDDPSIDAELRARIPRPEGTLIFVSRRAVQPCPPCGPEGLSPPGCRCSQEPPMPVPPQGSPSADPSLHAVREAAVERLGPRVEVARLDTSALRAASLDAAPYFVVTVPPARPIPRPPQRFLFVFDPEHQAVYHKAPEQVAPILSRLGLLDALDSHSPQAWLTLAHGLSEGRLIAHWSTASSDAPHHPPRVQRTQDGTELVGWFQVAPPSPAMERVSLLIDADRKIHFRRGTSP
ncbi:MAG: hypothetical protein EA397_12745 [Deltaproteobacteria bacterium]|nr:MAG: hypothetical protein EA397_12745 [Deltaproteobacteria bacterium]